MTHKRVVPIRISDKHERPVAPMVLTIFGKRYQIQSEIRMKTYDLLQDVSPRRCDRRYLEILEQAAKEGEAQVDDVLRLLLQTTMGKQTIVNKEAFSEFLNRCEQAPAITDVHIAEVSLASFDLLFSQAGVEVWQ